MRISSLFFLSQCAVAAVLTGSSSTDAVQISATFNDPHQTYAGYYQNLTACLEGAAAHWATYIDFHPDAVLDIEFAFADIPTASGGSRGSYFVERIDSSLAVWESDISYEIMNGVVRSDKPIGESDGVITIGFNYLSNRFWYDPDPFARNAPVPAGRIDAVSTIAHELGHVMGFNGYHDSTTGELDGFARPFDLLVSGPDSNGILYFNGEIATRAYGGPVPLTLNNSKHLGNREGLPGDDLLHGLMNGVRGLAGDRRWASRTDLAVLADLGYTVSLPSFVEGDSNGDGRVDAADYTAWRDSVGLSGIGIAADLKLDGVVDTNDWIHWAANYGRSALSPSSQSTPEPTTLIYVASLVGTATLFFQSKRARENE
jgi:hypothetical protein